MKKMNKEYNKILNNIIDFMDKALLKDKIKVLTDIKNYIDNELNELNKQARLYFIPK